MRPNSGVGIVNSIAWPTTTIWSSVGVFFFVFYSSPFLHFIDRTKAVNRHVRELAFLHWPSDVTQVRARAKIKTHKKYMNSGAVAKRIAYMVKTSWSQAMNFIVGGECFSVNGHDLQFYVSTREWRLVSLWKFHMRRDELWQIYKWNGSDAMKCCRAICSTATRPLDGCTAATRCIVDAENDYYHLFKRSTLLLDGSNQKSITRTKIDRKTFPFHDSNYEIDTMYRTRDIAPLPIHVSLFHLCAFFVCSASGRRIFHYY